MSRVRQGGRAPRRPPRWVLAVLVLAAGGAVVAIAVLARERSEARLQPQALPPAAVGPEALEAEAEEPPDAALEKLVEEANAANASLAALDGAAHALLVRERFEEAEPLVLRALARAPQDAEATIHRVVLQGVTGDTARARSALEKLASGAAGWEASMFEAGFALNDGDDAAALRALQRFRAQAPPGEVQPEVISLMAELEGRLASPPAHKAPQKQP